MQCDILCLLLLLLLLLLLYYYLLCPLSKVITFILLKQPRFIGFIITTKEELEHLLPFRF